MAPLNVLYTITHGEMGGVHRFLDSVFVHHTTEVRPIVLAFKEGAWLDELRKRGLKVYCIDDARLREPARCFREVNAILGSEQIQIVHSTYSWCHSLTYPAAVWRGCRTIWFHHGPISDRRWQGWMNVVPTDLLLTNSDYMLGRVRRTFHCAKRLGFVYYGIDPDTLGPDVERRARFRRLWGLNQETIAVGIVGFIDTWKGQDIFLKAARLLSMHQMPVRMFVIGGPRDGTSVQRCLAFENQLREYTRSNKLADLVSFTGHLDIRDGALDGLDIIVHASIEPEPFGMTILEAMAKQKTIIASNEGGPREILTDGVDGLLIKPREPEILAHTIRELCDDIALREKLSVSARTKAVKDFAPQKAVQSLEQWYRHVL